MWIWIRTYVLSLYSYKGHVNQWRLGHMCTSHLTAALHSMTTSRSPSCLSTWKPQRQSGKLPGCYSTDNHQLCFTIGLGLNTVVLLLKYALADSAQKSGHYAALQCFLLLILTTYCALGWVLLCFTDMLLCLVINHWTESYRCVVASFPGSSPAWERG